MKTKIQCVFYGFVCVLMIATVVVSFLCEGFKNIFSFDQEYSYSTLKIKNSDDGGVVYVDGAVLHSGYYAFKEGDTYGDIIEKAETLFVSFVGVDLKEEIPLNTKVLYVSFVEGGRILYPINVNSDMFAVFADQVNLHDDVVQLICAYKNINGRFENKNQVRQILTEEQWQDSFFRFYIGE